MNNQKILIGFVVMSTWLGLVLAQMTKPDDYVEMLKAIMAGAVMIHLSNRP